MALYIKIYETLYKTQRFLTEQSILGTMIIKLHIPVFQMTLKGYSWNIEWYLMIYRIVKFISAVDQFEKFIFSSEIRSVDSLPTNCVFWDLVPSDVRVITGHKNINYWLGSLDIDKNRKMWKIISASQDAFVQHKWFTMSDYSHQNSVKN